MMQVIALLKFMCFCKIRRTHKSRCSSSIVAGLFDSLIFFQMGDGEVLVVGGHDDQAVLDSVELINLTSSGVGLSIVVIYIIQIYSAIKAKFNNQNYLVIYEARHSCCYCQSAEHVSRNAQ